MSKVHTDVPRFGPRDGAPHSFESLRAGWDAVCRVLGAGLHAFQRAQMMRALSGMSDGQLAGIGLRRSDIPRHAERLVSREDEGASRRGMEA